MRWLFKHYMLLLIKDFKRDYKERYAQTKDESMRPDIYWLEKYLTGELKEESNGERD